jgi:xylulokinase
LNTSCQVEKYYIGIDLGTTHIKAAIFKEDGTMVQIIKTPTPMDEDLYGQIYDPLLFYDVVTKQVSELIENYKNIAGISITGMAEAGLIINKRTLIEETVILPWFDKRTTDLANEIGEEQKVHNFYLTGLHNSYKFGIYKFLWLLKEKAIEQENAIWLSVCDYIVWKLTGQFVTDPSFAARTYVYDIVKNTWDRDRLHSYGLNEYNFPKVIKSGSVAGFLSGSMLSFRTSEFSIPVCIGGHDHICAAYAMLNNDPERICNSIGTAETYLGIIRNLSMERILYDSGLVYGPFLNDRDYFWMGNISSSGQSVEWFRKNLQKSEIEYSELNDKLEKAPQNPTDIIYLPYLSGIGSPYFQSDVSGAFLGLRVDHDRWDMLKAILEGINYQGKWVLSLVPNDIKSKQKELICVGGATDSDTWMQMKANILDLPVKVPQVHEATLLGAVAIMIYNNYGLDRKDSFLREIQIQKKYDINKSIQALYQDIYRNKYTFLAETLIKKEMSKKE